MTIINNASDDAQIGQLIAHWMVALRSKDVDRLMSHYATDVVVFDLAPPLQYRDYRENWEAWFPTFRELHERTWDSAA
jgi:ketosteroid isomerase-like protein